MEYQLLSDELLVKLLRVDDRGAFEEIYRRFWKLLFKAAQNKLKSTEVIEELIQEVFLSLWEKRGTQQIENLKSYLFGMLKYHIIGRYRSRILAEKYADFVLNKEESIHYSTESELNCLEIVSIFENAIRTLPEKTSRIFLMSRLENQTTREIAEKLNIPERTVEYHITQSLKLLRVSLKDFLPVSVLLILL